MVLFVMMVLIVAGVLVAAYGSTASGLAREEHRTAQGEVALVLAENCIEEAFYNLFNRVNAPRESSRFPVDVYRLMRDLQPGKTVSYKFPPLLAWRTAQMPGATLEPVEVSMRILRVDVQARVSRQLVPLPTPTPLAPRGTQRRGCNNLTFRPVVNLERISIGEAVLRARVRLDSGTGPSVVRQLEVGHELRIGEVLQTPRVNWVDLVPIRSWQLVDREVTK